MSEAPEKTVDKTGGLHVGWDELNDLVSPRLGRDRFRLLIKRKVAQEGFPPFREEWGGFYWPAVNAWLDNDNGVAANGPVRGDVEDGPENFDATAGEKARLQDRAPRAPVLVRQTGDSRSDGIPRHLHSAGSGRR